MDYANLPREISQNLHTMGYPALPTALRIDTHIITVLFDSLHKDLSTRRNVIRYDQERFLCEIEEIHLRRSGEEDRDAELNPNDVWSSTPAALETEVRLAARDLLFILLHGIEEAPHTLDPPALETPDAHFAFNVAYLELVFRHQLLRAACGRLNYRYLEVAEQEAREQSLQQEGKVELTGMGTCTDAPAADDKDVSAVILNGSVAQASRRPGDHRRRRRDEQVGALDPVVEAAGEEDDDGENENENNEGPSSDSSHEQDSSITRQQMHDLIALEALYQSASQSAAQDQGVIGAMAPALAVLHPGVALPDSAQRFVAETRPDSRPVYRGSPRRRRSIGLGLGRLWTRLWEWKRWKRTESAEHGKRERGRMVVD